MAAALSGSTSKLASLTKANAAPVMKLATRSDEIGRLDTLLTGLVARISAADVVPDPNPIGVPRPG